MARFETNWRMLDEVGERLSTFAGICWVIGGAASGKSTVCQTLAAGHGTSVYDMDEHVYGSYIERYSWERHPASKTWFSAEDSLGWVLSLTADEFDELNRAANAEYLDLFAEDVAAMDSSVPLIVDGGITHPSVLLTAVPRERVVCLEVDDERSQAAWSDDPGRASMKDAVLSQPDPDDAWRRFLAFDCQINETLRAECLEHGLTVLHREESTTIDALAGKVQHYFGLDA